MAGPNAPSQARYQGRRGAQPQQKPDETVLNRAPEPLNLAKPELLPSVPQTDEPAP